MDQNLRKNFAVTKNPSKPSKTKSELLYEEVITKNFQIISDLMEKLNKITTKQEDYEKQLHKCLKKYSKMEADIEAIHNEHRRQNLDIYSNMDDIKGDVDNIDNHLRIIAQKFNQNKYLSTISSSLQFKSESEGSNYKSLMNTIKQENKNITPTRHLSINQKIYQVNQLQSSNSDKLNILPPQPQKIVQKTTVENPNNEQKKSLAKKYSQKKCSQELSYSYFLGQSRKNRPLVQDRIEEKQYEQQSSEKSSSSEYQEPENSMEVKIRQRQRKQGLNKKVNNRFKKQSSQSKLSEIKSISETQSQMNMSKPSEPERSSKQVKINKMNLNFNQQNTTTTKKKNMAAVYLEKKKKINQNFQRKSAMAKNFTKKNSFQNSEESRNSRRSHLSPHQQEQSHKNIKPTTDLSLMKESLKQFKKQLQLYKEGISIVVTDLVNKLFNSKNQFVQKDEFIDKVDHFEKKIKKLQQFLQNCANKGFISQNYANKGQTTKALLFLEKKINLFFEEVSEIQKNEIEKQKKNEQIIIKQDKEIIEKCLMCQNGNLLQSSKKVEPPRKFSHSKRGPRSISSKMYSENISSFSKTSFDKNRSSLWKKFKEIK